MNPQTRGFSNDVFNAEKKMLLKINEIFALFYFNFLVWNDETAVVKDAEN